MARTEHGINLRSGLILLPGSTFTKTKSGYDTGSRTFACDTQFAEALAPARNSADSVHTGMAVDTYTITEGVAGKSTISVQYKGTLGDPAEPTETEENEIIYDCDAQVDAILITDVYFTKYSPRVSVPYVTAIFPAFNVGAYVVPPKFADKIPSQSVVIEGETWVLSYSQSGWRLENRQVRSVGETYELTDTYVYSYKVNGALGPDGFSYTFDPV